MDESGKEGEEKEKETHGFGGGLKEWLGIYVSVWIIGGL
tara:strand:+ start:496 stop:612 length:117 start_codon:yes stop_codon:yes gene_type:complete